MPKPKLGYRIREVHIGRQRDDEGKQTPSNTW